MYACYLLYLILLLLHMYIIYLFQAHKVILSACSPWFRSALKRNPHQHPLFFLKGIKHSQMMGLIDFMYKGEVSVAQEDLNNFLVVAEELQIKV